jgi:hypothetical protein
MAEFSAFLAVFGDFARRAIFGPAVRTLLL